MKAQQMQISRYVMEGAAGTPELRIALVADLHNEPGDDVLPVLRRERPDIIAVPGDLMTQEDALDANCNGLRFLREAVRIAPVFYSLGNHEPPANEKCAEKGLSPVEFAGRIVETGATLLDNSYAEFRGICIGGVTSVGSTETRRNQLNPAWLYGYLQLPGPKLLLCHNPEYYPKYIRPFCVANRLAIPLVLSGHAHGGQWRIGNLGVYAPGQGLFPKYTSGVYDGRLVISRGLSNMLGPPLTPKPLPIPRWGNPREIVILQVKMKTQA